jgi:hypothetical protein
VLDAAVRLLSRSVEGPVADAEVSVDPLWLVFASDESVLPSGRFLQVQEGPLTGAVLEPSGARGTSALRLFLLGADAPVARVELPPLLACTDLAELDNSVLDEALKLYQGLVQVLSDRFDAVEAAISLVAATAKDPL